MSQPMDEPSPSSQSVSPRGWLDKLVQIITGEPRNREDLIETLETAQGRGLLDHGALAMIEGVLELHELRARDLMIPRGQMAVLGHTMNFNELLQHILESGHSRYPVVGDDRDEVLGLLLAKDLLHLIPHAQNQANEAQVESPDFDIAPYLRPALFVPESKRIDALLAELRGTRNHMALVIDEYGGIAGLVTIEDVLEQIVGAIDDEHDVAEDILIRAAGNDRYIIHALAPIKDFNEITGAALDDHDFDTVGGLVAHAIGHLPQRDEVIELGGFKFRVISADRRRLHRMRVTRLSAHPAPHED